MQGATDLPDLFAGLATSVRRSVDADACTVSLYDEEGDCVRDVGASVGKGARLNFLAQEFPLKDYAITKKVIGGGGSIEISVFDDDADEAEKALIRTMGYSRLLMTRLAMAGSVTGIVEIYRFGDRPFGAEAESRVGTLSAFAANTYALIQTTAKLESHYTETIEALVSALEARDPYTEAHAGRIKDFALALGVALRIPMAARRSVRLGAILHDVGKIGISDAILSKPGPLTQEEWAVMKTHPQVGERMLRRVDFLAEALPVVRHHHERWDGGGYPDGLAGTAIPIGARIVAACDAFDAMTTDRPYRAAISRADACDELLAGAGTQFDPRCARLLVEVLLRGGPAEDLESRLVRYVG